MTTFILFPTLPRLMVTVGGRGIHSTCPATWLPGALRGRSAHSTWRDYLLARIIVFVSLSLPLLKYTFVDSRIGVSRTTALLMYIYCTMAPGAHSTDESSQDQRTCLRSPAHSTDVSCPDQRPCLSKPALSTDVSCQDLRPCLISPRYPRHGAVQPTEEVQQHSTTSCQQQATKQGT